MPLVHERLADLGELRAPIVEKLEGILPEHQQDAAESVGIAANALHGDERLLRIKKLRDIGVGTSQFLIRPAELLAPECVALASSAVSLDGLFRRDKLRVVFFSMICFLL
jgi:hypothetical protein